ncbi:unnamed protein product [Cylicocyclus nassatus]|uniref:Uncharacterized protein n=1 Tax=Cylicocyclus nassatus TaxID=53992 RepID=A0AA36GMW4_CYLNA|nr:unnamed protein product [Cylicocyclus nassatus]
MSMHNHGSNLATISSIGILPDHVVAIYHRLLKKCLQLPAWHSKLPLLRRFDPISTNRSQEEPRRKDGAVSNVAQTGKFPLKTELQN